MTKWIAMSIATQNTSFTYNSIRHYTWSDCWTKSLCTLSMGIFSDNTSICACARLCWKSWSLSISIAPAILCWLPVKRFSSDQSWVRPLTNNPLGRKLWSRWIDVGQNKFIFVQRWFLSLWKTRTCQRAFQDKVQLFAANFAATFFANGERAPACNKMAAIGGRSL